MAISSGMHKFISMSCNMLTPVHNACLLWLTRPETLDTVVGIYKRLQLAGYHT